MIAISDIKDQLQARRQIDSYSHRLQPEALNARAVVTHARPPPLPFDYINPMFGSTSRNAAALALGRNSWYLRGIQSPQPHQLGMAAVRTASSRQSNSYAELRNFGGRASWIVNKLFTSPVKNTPDVITNLATYLAAQLAGSPQLQTSQVSA